MPDLFHQTAPVPYPADARAFADALEAIMADGTHDLGGIARALNERHVVAGDRNTWTAAALGAYLAELANA